MDPIPTRKILVYAKNVVFIDEFKFNLYKNDKYPAWIKPHKKFDIFAVKRGGC